MGGGAYDSIPTTNGAPPRQKQSVLLAAVYGLVASLMCAPVMMSLCQLGVRGAFESDPRHAIDATQLTGPCSRAARPSSSPIPSFHNTLQS